MRSNISRGGREGQRSIRSYHVESAGGSYWNRWSLWQVVDGKRRRVGTAYTEEETFIFFGYTEAEAKARVAADKATTARLFGLAA